MKRARTRYVPSNIPTVVDAEGLSAKKTFNHLSWSQYTIVRKKSNAPLYREHIQQYQRELIQQFPSQPLISAEGAYFDVEKLCDHVYELYAGKHAIGIHPLKQSASHDWILSFDNRRIFGSNEAFHIRPVDVVKTQSVLHVHDFAIVHASESNETIRNVVAESHCNEFLLGFSDHFQRKYGILSNIYSSGDWISIIGELAAPKPSTKKLTDKVCWACGTTRAQLINGWLDNPFKFTNFTLKITDWPSAALWALPLEQRRYDWMHGCTNLLSNTVKDTFELLPATATGKRGEYKEFMSDIHEN